MNESDLEVPLEAIDECFQGAIPASVCSASLDGTPNTAYLSIVQRVDANHVALSRQFFNKTAANLMVNPRCEVLLVEPSTGRQFRLELQAERTELEGPLFESMRARLDAVASQTGMTDVFRLRGVDVCRVLRSSLVPTIESATAVTKRPRADLAGLASFSSRIAAATSIDDLIGESLAAFEEYLGLSHSLFMVLDALTPDRLYTVSSRGFASSGAGSEVRLGQGIVGVAVARRQLVRIGHMEFERTYSRAVRSIVERQAAGQTLQREIPLPGLPQARSHLAAPILLRDRALGALYFQSEESGRFREEEEHIVSVAAQQIGLGMAMLGTAPTAITASSPLDTQQAAVEVKYYSADDSVFLDNEYLIKGVAGRILWTLLQKYTAERRVDFTNREMRLDPQLDLPELHENLETRLILLRKRLEDRCDYLRILSTGRGRFRLMVARELRLRDVT